MIMNSVIVRYSEIGLKGKNRIVFEKKLMNNIRSCLNRNKINFSVIKKPMGRILIPEIDSVKPLNCVFGISSFSEAINAGFDIDKVKQTALSLIKDGLDGKSFYVSCQRLDKRFPVKSVDFAKELGEYIYEKTKAKVSFKKPGITLYAEIIDGFVYLFTEKKKGCGGLPLGIEGNIVALVEDESSLLAALLMMRRGCSVFCVAKKEFDISLLKRYVYGSRVELKILKTDNEINEFAEKVNAKAIVVADTFESIEEYDFNIPVYRPLSAFSKEQIEEKLDEFRKRVC
ncbi:hypothetical protein JW851_00450 [Candidatus Woesearchaeota archaeon]|nr:hypothetical protein [Candidatus Woesearchaeota archaeon]